MQAENKINNIQTVSLGCRLNALELEKIQAMLAPLVNAAIVVNTCAVTAEAERQSGQLIRRLAEKNPGVPVFVTGCASTRNPNLFSQMENVLVINNHNKLNAAAYINALATTPHTFDAPQVTWVGRPAPRMSKQYVQVQNGCNHQCTYCVTRLLRGPSVSIDYSEILRDTINATARGFNEIVLTGVDTASYARNGMLISDVCDALLRDVPGIRRLRISSFDPASPQVFKIIDLMHRDARMMPHMHLSMQSGSDTILRAMRRRHTADTVRQIVAYAGNDITFSWDIICGFPGETDDLFHETLQLVHATRPIKIHAFPFSARPGTVAADMPGQIDRATAKQRVHEISIAAENARHDFMSDHLGQTVSVLVEENNIARTPHDIDVKIHGDIIPSRTICNVKLVEISGGAYIGIRQ